MTPQEAARMLGLSESADAAQARERFIAARAELEKKIAEALTPGLHERYRRALAVTVEAYETWVMAADSSLAGVTPPLPATRAESATAQTEPLTPPSLGRKLLWHFKGMIRGALVSVFGVVCMAIYDNATEGTWFAIPSVDDDLWLTGVAGVMAFVVWPGLFMWEGSVKASAGLPYKTAKAASVILGFMALFIGSSVIQNYTAPVKAVAAPLAAPSPPTAVAPVTPAPAKLVAVAPVAAAVREPTPDELAVRGHHLAMGTGGAAADPVKAMALYAQAAEKGSVLAMTYLEEAYAEGKIVPADPTAATLWRTRKQAAEAKEWEKAAGNGDAQAAHDLAYAYWLGEGVEVNQTKAVALWRQAAAAQIAPAMFQLGRSYAKGEGVEKDQGQAREWLQKAAALGVKDAESELAALDAADKARQAGAALVAAAEARHAMMANRGKLVSLAPGFAGWHGRRLQAPPSHQMLQASDVYIGMPFMRKQVGDRYVSDTGNAQAGLNRMIPAANLTQAKKESAENSTTSLFSFFQDTRVIQQEQGFFTRSADLCGGVGLGWVVIVWVHDWGEGDEMKLGFGVVAGNATLDEGIEEAFKLAMDGFRKRGGRVARSCGIKAGVSAKIDFAQLRRDKLKLDDALMPFEYTFYGPGSLDEVRKRGFAWQMPEKPQEFVGFVRELTQASLRDWQRYQLTFGLTGFGNSPRAGLAAPVFVQEQMARPAATADFRARVAGLKVDAVKGGAKPGLIVARQFVAVGEAISGMGGIRLLEYDFANRVAVFEDANQAIAARRL